MGTSLCFGHDKSYPQQQWRFNDQNSTKEVFLNVLQLSPAEEKAQVSKVGMQRVVVQHFLIRKL